MRNQERRVGGRLEAGSRLEPGAESGDVGKMRRGSERERNMSRRAGEQGEK